MTKAFSDKNLRTKAGNIKSPSLKNQTVDELVKIVPEFQKVEAAHSISSTLSIPNAPQRSKSHSCQISFLLGNIYLEISELLSFIIKLS